jgi:tyrosine--tRNA ligase
MKKHCENMSKRLAQRTLAYEVTKDIHSEKIATQCLKISDILFSKDSDILSLTNDDIKLLLGFLPSYVVKKDQTFIDFIKENKILNSNREIREFLSNGSFLLNNKIVNDENQVIEFQNFNKQYAILRKGKKEFIILKSK